MTRKRWRRRSATCRRRARWTWTACELSQADLDLLLTVDPQDWKLEADRMPEFFRMFGEHLPERLWELHQDLVDRLGSS